MHRDHAPDRPTSIDPEPDAPELPRPLTAQQRSRLEAKTWNWNAVHIYPGGQGPGVAFADYVGGNEPGNPLPHVVDHDHGDER